MIYFADLTDGSAANDGCGPPVEKQKSEPNETLKPTTMKSMKNFAAQQLSKKQMNEVRGGKYLCHCYPGDKPLTFTPELQSIFVVDDFEAALFMVQISCPNGGHCDNLG